MSLPHFLPDLLIHSFTCLTVNIKHQILHLPECPIKDEKTTSPNIKKWLTMAALWSLLLLIWVNIHPPIMSVCLMPTRPSTRQSNEICFEDYNNTDPNIVNHKIDITEPSYTTHLEPDYQDSANESNFEPVLESRTNSIQSQLPPRKFNSYHHHYQHHPHHHQPLNRPKSSSLFIPVAAYSITKKKPKKKPKIKSVPKMSASTVSVRRKRPNIVYEEATSEEDNDEQGEEPDLDGEGTEDDYEMRKESAVYGYIHKPEVIEFRGQYYYGQNGEDSTAAAAAGGAGGVGGGAGNIRYSKAPSNIEYDSVESPMMNERPHRVSYVPYESSYHEEPSATSIILAKLKKVAILKGITAKGLLLASLPLILTPVLSYLLTPVVIPITATTVAGRRRKRHAVNGSSSDWVGVPFNGTFPRAELNWTTNNVPDKKLEEAKILLQYLHKVKPDERLATSAVASFLECDGLFLPSDRCLEQLSCEFSDEHNANASKLDRAVTSIILAHLLHNEFISTKIKKRLKKSAKYGRSHGGQCKIKYPCERVLLQRAIRREQVKRRGRTRPTKEIGGNGLKSKRRSQQADN